MAGWILVFAVGIGTGLIVARMFEATPNSTSDLNDTSHAAATLETPSGEWVRVEIRGGGSGGPAITAPQSPSPHAEG